MPIQSTPVTTQSSINLSDINIDTDLDMGANSIVGYVSGNSSNLYNYFTYGYSYYKITPIELWNEATEYTINNSSTAKNCFSKTLNSTLNENLVSGYNYIVRHDFKLKSEGLTTARSEAFFSNDPSNEAKITCGGGTYRNVSIRTLPLAYNTTLTHQIKNSHTNVNYTTWTKDHIGYLVGYQPTTPLTASNFNLDKIISIILPNANDKIVFNNDPLNAITGVKQVFIQSNDIALLSDEYNNDRITYTGEGGGGGDELLDILKQKQDIYIPTLTQLDITGNPIIVSIT